MEEEQLWSAQDLSKGEIEISGRLVDASNATLFGEIRLLAQQSDDEFSTRTAAIVYKPIAGERPLWDFPDGNLASREVASYLLSEFADFKLVPTTVFRDGPFGPGAVQQWIEVDETRDLLSIARSQDPKIRKMALFDALVNNTDRKFGHILVDHFSNIYGCDHGVTFHSEPKLRTVIWQFAGMEFSNLEIVTLQRIISLGTELAAVLELYLTARELDSFFARTNMLLEAGHFPYPSEDWPPVPWPPV